MSTLDACAKRLTAGAPSIRSVPCAAPAMPSTTASSRTLDPGSWLHHSPLYGTPITPAIGGWLIGDTTMVSAIGQALHSLAATEEEVRRARIADRPVTFAFG